MSTTSFYHRVAKGATSGAIYVKHTHRGSTFRISTKVVVPAGKFDENELQVADDVPGALELEAAVLKVGTYVRTAARNLQQAGVEPTKEAMVNAYAQVLAYETRVRPRAGELVRKGKLRTLEGLQQELEELQEQVSAKKAQIVQLERELGVHQDRLLTTYFKLYEEEMAGVLSPASVRLFTKLRQHLEKDFPAWRIDQVNEQSMREFETYLREKKTANNSLRDHLTKVKTIVYHYARLLSLPPAQIQELREFKSRVKKKRGANVIYLTKQELEQLIALPLVLPHEAAVRDKYVLMCLTGVRWSDSAIRQVHVRDGNLVLSTEKTDNNIVVPLAPLALELLERHHFAIHDHSSQRFNQLIKRICERVPALRQEIEYKTYRGSNKATKTIVAKCTKISAHTARKTFINLGLAAGVSPVTLASMVGHEGVGLIMKTYGSDQVGRDKIASLMVEEAAGEE